MIFWRFYVNLVLETEQKGRFHTSEKGIYIHIYTYISIIYR